MLGLKIKMLRRRANLTQKEAARLLGIARSTLIKYEKTHSNIPLSVFVKIIVIYKLDDKDVRELIYTILKDINRQRE